VEQHAPAGLDRSIAQAVAAFEHAVRRDASAAAELRLSRRPSTTKAALKTSADVAQARRELTAALERLGWHPPSAATPEGPNPVLRPVPD
jgi:hypothetical protein